jgi:hypothetical protein
MGSGGRLGTGRVGPGGWTTGQIAAAVTRAVADADLFGLLGAGGTARQVSPAGGKALAARVPVCPRPMT